MSEQRDDEIAFVDVIPSGISDKQERKDLNLHDQTTQSDLLLAYWQLED
jgi:hypothetical protein